MKKLLCVFALLFFSLIRSSEVSKDVKHFVDYYKKLPWFDQILEQSNITTITDFDSIKPLLDTLNKAPHLKQNLSEYDKKYIVEELQKSLKKTPSSVGLSSPDGLSDSQFNSDVPSPTQTPPPSFQDTLYELANVDQLHYSMYYSIEFVKTMLEHWHPTFADLRKFFHSTPKDREKKYLEYIKYLPDDIKKPFEKLLESNLKGLTMAHVDDFLASFNKLLSPHQDFIKQIANNLSGKKIEDITWNEIKKTIIRQKLMKNDFFLDELTSNQQKNLIAQIKKYMQESTLPAPSQD